MFIYIKNIPETQIRAFGQSIVHQKVLNYDFEIRQLGNKFKIKTVNFKIVCLQ